MSVAISSNDVKVLRERTNAPMMECKKALTEAGGDMEKAVELLRKKFKDAVDKGKDRETGEGRIAAAIDNARKIGALLEMRCESAPVAKSEHFVNLCNLLVQEAIAQGVDSAEALAALPKVQEKITETVGLIRENMKPGRLTRLTGGLMGSYIHHDGSTGVLLQVEGTAPNDQLLRDVCMHVVARNPAYAVREDVPADVLDKEKEIARSQITADPKNQGKPANILDKIVEGKLKTWYGENVLLEQPFVKDDSKTVGDVLKGAGFKFMKFVRYKIGK